MTFVEAINAELAKGHHVNIAQAERFWNAATAAERERCAKIAGQSVWERMAETTELSERIVAAIRAGEEPK